MQIHNAIITGSFSYNGADLSNVTSSNAYSASLSSRTTDLESTSSVLVGASASFSSILSSISSSQQQLSSSFLTLTASFNAVSASQQQISASYIALSASYDTFSGSASTRITANSSSIQQVSSSQQQISASLLQVSASYISLSGSYNTYSSSVSTRTTQIEQVYATTGSNSFRADQSITGSLVVSSTITAQTLVVQTVTSSIVYSSGSNIFGSDLNSRQTFTGSIAITGSIGIGTTPAADFPLRIRGGGSSRIKLESPSTQASALDFYNDSLALWSMVVDNTQTYAKIENRALSIDAIRFYSSSNNVILTPTTGNVGIGTTNPTQKVEIQAPANLWATRFVGANVASQSYGFYVDAGTNATDTNAMFRSNGGSCVYFYIGGNGKVGVGTSSPDRLLTVNGDSNLLGNNYISTSKFFQWEGGAYWTTRVTSTGNQFEIYRGDTGVSPFTITSTNLVQVSNATQTDDLGLLQIQNTYANPGSNTSLTVKSYSGTGQFMQWENYGMRIGSRIKTNSGAGGIYFTYGNDSVGMTITSGGQVGINTIDAGIQLSVKSTSTTSSSYPLFLLNSAGTGNMYVRSDSYGYLNDSAWHYISDLRMKENISDILEGLSIISELKPKHFDYIDGAKNRIGFIAQDVQEILPNLVTISDEKTGMLALQTDALIPILVKAIQEQQCTICSQASMINTLKTCLGIN